MSVETVTVYLFGSKNEYAYGGESELTLRPSMNEDPFYDGEFLLASKTVAIQYEAPSSAELTNKAVDSLQKAVSKEQTASALRVKDLQDRIQSLLALPAPKEV